MTQQERMEKGLLWWDDGVNLSQQKKAKDLMYEFNHTKPSEEEKRIGIAKELFGHIGDPVWIMQPITLAIGKTVSIGSGTYINSNLVLVDDHTITIGENCLIAPNVTLCTTGHPIHPDVRKKGGMYSFPVTIGNNVWIGSNVVVMPGVTIGDNTVIGAGSIVTKDIPANVVAFGNPCRIVREITDEDRKYYYKDRKIED